MSELLSYDRATELGHGGSSKVFVGTWYARDCSRGEPVAVKKMDKAAATGQERREVEVHVAAFILAEGYIWWHRRSRICHIPTLCSTLVSMTMANIAIL